MDKVTSSILATLEKLEINSSVVEHKTLKYLEKIETVFDTIFATQEQIHNELKSNKPSLSKIASDTNIARQTLYNNPLLKQYIQVKIDEFKANDIASRNEYLNDRISGLNTTIEKMQIRDVNVELLKYKISLLDEELKLKQRENIELRKKYNNAVYKKTDIEPVKAEVVNFPTRK